jgi:hypothetical protein
MSVVTAAPLVFFDEQRLALERMARSTSLPARQVTQAKGLLWAWNVAAGELPRSTVCRAGPVARNRALGTTRPLRLPVRSPGSGISALGLKARSPRRLSAGAERSV